MNRFKTELFLVFFLVAFPLVLQACSKVSAKQIESSSGYHAVFLDNGQVFFGTAEGIGTDYPVLRNVFYVQNRVNPETKQPVSILVKRGSEWHGPTSMTLNARHIVVIEPVSSESKVGKLIKEAQKADSNLPK